MHILVLHFMIHNRVTGDHKVDLQNITHITPKFMLNVYIPSCPTFLPYANTP